MTEDEKRQQKAMLLLEHQEAIEELKHLQEKAKRSAENIKTVADWVARCASPFTGVDYDKTTATLDANVRTNLAQYREKLDMNALLKEVDDLKKAEGKVQDLASRKASLGL
jgi:hypothetical protein